MLPKDSASNKENVNSNNKPEVPKLSVEPQQMKRKKKGGGYNLRKSLAWDRAFFIEEGNFQFPISIFLDSLLNCGKSMTQVIIII